MFTRRLLQQLALPLLMTLAHAHEGHEHYGSPPTTWAELHLQSEHHISNFDPGAFWMLHDFDNNGLWNEETVLRLYGLLQDDTPAELATPEKKKHVWDTVRTMIDTDNDHQISRDEWMLFCNTGGQLPDLGTGPGHHGDDEYEYEIHHFERYHGEDTTEADLTHPEDIAHFRKHELEDEAAARQAVLEQKAVNEANIPKKFLVQ